MMKQFHIGQRKRISFVLTAIAGLLVYLFIEFPVGFAATPTSQTIIACHESHRLLIPKKHSLTLQ
jgi:hypothetical protein